MVRTHRGSIFCLHRLVVRTPGFHPGNGGSIPPGDVFLKAVNYSKNPKKFCVQILPKVSRTFALNIKCLAGKVYWANVVAYLLCRIIDTIEDAPNLASEKKIKIIKAFVCLLKTFSAEEIKKWVLKTKPVEASSSEKKLLENTLFVLKVFFSQKQNYRLALLPPIAEMANGMCETLTKPKKTHEGVAMPFETESDLDVYCDFVAGAPGKLITNVFSINIFSKKRKSRMKTHAQAFGLGLQYINVLKDFLKDIERGWCYIPKKCIEKQKLSFSHFFKNTFPNQSHQVIVSLLPRTQKYLKQALIYIEAIPVWHFRKRLFCALPLFFALSTWSILKTKMPSKSESIKISRREVKRCLRLAFWGAISNRLLRKTSARV